MLHNDMFHLLRCTYRMLRVSKMGKNQGDQLLMLPLILLQVKTNAVVPLPDF